MNNKEIKRLAVQITDKSLSRAEMIRARSDLREEYRRRVSMGRRSAPEYSNDELRWIFQLDEMCIAIREMLKEQKVA